jgi:hypothetical protein
MLVLLPDASELEVAFPPLADELPIEEEEEFPLVEVELPVVEVALPPAPAAPPAPPVPPTPPAPPTIPAPSPDPKPTTPPVMVFVFALVFVLVLALVVVLPSPELITDPLFPMVPSTGPLEAFWAKHIPTDRTTSAASLHKPLIFIFSFLSLYG